jgi:hypothetical protein
MRSDRVLRFSMTDGVTKKCKLPVIEAVGALWGGPHKLDQNRPLLRESLREQNLDIVLLGGSGGCREGDVNPVKARDACDGHRR